MISRSVRGEEGGGPAAMNNIDRPIWTFVAAGVGACKCGTAASGSRAGSGVLCEGSKISSAPELVRRQAEGERGTGLAGSRTMGGRGRRPMMRLRL